MSPDVPARFGPVPGFSPSGRPKAKAAGQRRRRRGVEAFFDGAELGMTVDAALKDIVSMGGMAPGIPARGN